MVLATNKGIAKEEGQGISQNMKSQKRFMKSSKNNKWSRKVLEKANWKDFTVSEIRQKRVRKRKKKRGKIEFKENASKFN